MGRDRSSDILHQIISESGRSRIDDESDCRGRDFVCVEPDMTVDQIIRKHPDCIAVFRRHGLNCCSCVNSRVETIESISVSLGAPLTELLHELNIAARVVVPNTARIFNKESD